MDFCRTVELLYAAIPLRPFRDWLIRAHMDACPRCQIRLLSREEARTLMVGPGQLGDAGELWQRIGREAARLAAASETRPRGGRLVWRLVWRLAPAAALAAVTALAGFWLLRQAAGPGFEARAAAPADRFVIAYVKVDGAPAQTFVYQPQGTDTVLVWAQKTP
jgi:hypothetical protein